MTEENRLKLEQKTKRMQDALSLKEPDRVPIEITGGQFMVNYAGFTMAEVIYDTSLEKIKYAIKKYLNDFDPDVVTSISLHYFGEGPAYELLGPKNMLVSGMKDPRIGEDSIQQFIEFPTLLDDEFDEFFNDRAAWTLNKYLPRISSVMEPFEKLIINPNQRGVVELAHMLSTPEMRQSLQILWEVSDFYKDFRPRVAKANRELVELGYPSFAGGSAIVPFDKYSDTFRGTILSLLDLLTREEDVLKYIDSYQQDMLRHIRRLNSDGSNDGKYVSMMLHKGFDTFMSDEHYRKFYWQHLREEAEVIAENGMIPNLFCEGRYMTRLDCLTELPKGKAYCYFEDMDMGATKKKLEGIACVGGGFPSALLQFGSREAVVDECKRLLDACAPGGGYIFKLSAGLHGSKPENVEAMFETVREYGRYR